LAGEQVGAVADLGIGAVVFDLDGVIRHWNDDELDLVESAVGLPPRTILDVAFGPELGPACTTGALTYRAWMDEIRRRVVAGFGPDVIPALDAWEANVGRVDAEMVRVLRRTRRVTTVALLSNGSTRLRRDLHVLDLLDEFDVVFNTAEIGIAKPDPEVFRLVCAELGSEPGHTFFVDDLAENVAGARTAGLVAHQHTDSDSTVEALARWGVEFGPTDPMTG
jgi:putative hydrolase of the HAD superfamily